MFTALIVLGVRTRRIYRIGLPDGEVETLCDATGPAPDGIAVDESDSRVYWTTMGAGRRAPHSDDGFDFSERNGGVHTARLNGTDVKDVLAPARSPPGSSCCSPTGCCTGPTARAAV